MNDLERRVHTAIKECYDVVIAPTYGLGSALAAVFMKIHGRAPHRATFRTDYYAVDLPEGREWSDAESKGKIIYRLMGNSTQPFKVVSRCSSYKVGR